MGTLEGIADITQSPLLSNHQVGMEPSLLPKVEEGEHILKLTLKWDMGVLKIALTFLRWSPPKDGAFREG